MSAEPVTTPAPWVADAVRVVALARRDGRNQELAAQVTRQLLAGEAAREVHGILTQGSSWQRILGWEGLLENVQGTEPFRLFAYHPADVLEWFERELPEMCLWSTLVELYEAWFQLASTGRLHASGIRPRGGVVGSAYLARTRWLLLSLPFRDGWGGRIEQLDRLRLHDESSTLAVLARQAREEWLAVLDAIDDYPDIKADLDIEREAQDLTACTITREQLDRLDTTATALAATRKAGATADPSGAEIERYVVTRLLLPRYALERVWPVVWRRARRAGWPRSWRVNVAFTAAASLAFAAAAGLLGVGLGLQWHRGAVLTAAAASAVAGYALVAVAASVQPATAWPWLLRQPASAAVGLLALTAIPPDWWHDGGRGGTAAAAGAAAALALAGLGYLYVEAASHDVAGQQRAWRPLVVGAAGYAHAGLVSLIGLRFLVPVLAQRPQARPLSLACWWAAQGCGPGALPVWLLLALAASWSFAAGVFLQILWDDQPVTAPLAHVSWRRGR